MISYGRQSISEEDILAVVDVLRSDFLTQGPMVPKFEKAISHYTEAAYAVATNSGTSSLHLACLALELGPGDILWTTPITYVASSNCALYCGAEVDFVDINPQTFNLCAEALEEKLKKAKQNGNLPKVVVPVHMCGLPCDMEKISNLSNEYCFSIIEDASHAMGGRYKNKPIGKCIYSDITVFSFHPVKNMTTGEGGMAVTNNKDLANKMRLLRSHGITQDPALMTHQPDGPWYYQQIDLGFNYRLTDIQAALGISQLKRIDEFVNRRHQIAKRYNERLGELPVRLQLHPDECYSSMHLYVIRIQIDEAQKSQKQIFQQMRAEGIGVNIHYIPVHTQPYYQQLGFQQNDFSEAELYYREALSLPIYPELMDEQVDKVIYALQKILH